MVGNKSIVFLLKAIFTVYSFYKKKNSNFFTRLKSNSP
jgi:hypothetical protein